MRLLLGILLMIAFSGCSKTIKIEESVLKDKIKGGLVGQLLGNLNGIPYEEKYNNEPGSLSGYIPGLPLGAFTDDDTDIEWLHIYFMEKYKQPLLQYDTIVSIWKRNMNYKTYASNFFTRELMEIGFVPTETSNICLNPWAHINVAGQFTCENYGLIAPAMPQTAGRIGLHYTRIVIDSEPAQTTQFYTAMIATAYTTSDMNEILKAGIATLDKKSVTYRSTMDAIAWHKEFPDNWILSRNKIRNNYYFIHDNNKAIMNHASIVSQLLYGDLDFTRTMEIAFNWGFDADCNAATLGTIIGVINGYSWFEDQGWEFFDRYYNNARPELPTDETITSYADRIFNVAQQVIMDNGGHLVAENGKNFFAINTEKPKVLIETIDILKPYEELYSKYNLFTDSIFADNTASDEDLKKAIYLSLALKKAEGLKSQYPEQWEKAVSLLQQHHDFMYIIFNGFPSYINRLAESTGIRPIPVEPKLDGNTEFRLEGFENAKNVFLGGNMNHWRIWKNPMHFDGKGWVCRIDLSPGKYEYKFYVDGKWVFDPNQPIENNFEGNTNSVRIINNGQF